MGRYFNHQFTEHSATVTRSRQRLPSIGIEGYISRSHAVRKVDNSARLAQITVPALVIAGRRIKAPH